MDKIAKTLKNISNKVYIVEKWVLMIAVIAVTAVNFVNVIMRYIFKSGLAYCMKLKSYIVYAADSYWRKHCSKV